MDGVPAALSPPGATTSRTVGRVAERDRLERLLQRPGGASVAVTGEAGVGKTTLVNDAATAWRSGGGRVIRANAERPQGAQLSLWRRPAHELGLELPDKDPGVAPSEHVWELTALLRDSLGDIAPVLLVVDDLHWADGPSLTVLRLLSNELAGFEVTFLSATRESDSAELAELMKSSAVIGLGGLSEEETGRLAASLGEAEMGPDAVQALHGRTGGNPLLVTEVVNGGTADSGPAADVLQASLAKAGDDALETLSHVAIGGAGITVGVLADALGEPVPTVQRTIDRATDAGVLLDDEGRVRFRHDLLAEAAAGRLARQERRAVHAALAGSWRRAGEIHQQARHLVAALPTDARVEEVVGVCTVAADHLVTTRRSGDAVDLLVAATAACERAGATDLHRARLRLLLGEAQWNSGQVEAGLETFTAGAAIELDDLELSAALETASHRRHRLHIANPEARARLLRLDERMGRDDSPLRVELLGRLGALAQQPPFDPDLADQVTARAVAMARRLDDPASLAQALHDRYLWPVPVERLHERDLAVDEMVTMSRRAGRPDLLLVGLQWRLDADLNRLDLASARDTVDEAIALAAFSPTPEWRARVLVQRAQLAGLAGDRHGALELVGQVDRVLASASLAGLPHGHRQEHELFVRHALGSLFRVVDPQPGLIMDNEPWVNQTRISAVQALAAGVELVAGRPGAALRRINPYLREPERYIESATPLMTLCQFARFAIEFEVAEVADGIRDLLLPYRGRIVFLEQIEQVDVLLAGLSRMVADPEHAVGLARAGVRAAERLDSPPLRAHALAELGRSLTLTGDADGGRDARADAERIAARVGMALEWAGRNTGPVAPAPPVPIDARVTVLRRERHWLVSHRARSFDVRTTTGLEQLGRLLVAPGREISATELAGFGAADAPAVERDVGPALDSRAKKEYRRRVLELQAEMDDSDLAGDAGRSARAKAEYDALLRALRSATGLGGRDRPQRSGDERARVNVTRSIRRAIEAIAGHSAVLGKHLQLSVRTGRWCCYEPDPTTAISWTIRD